ncbi:phosphocholine cytidylyltransferase family protein [Amphiplicatus metriothermophilus]|uniref:Choline kinase n=1 Tax=Amphiplicatus metriothermophilus TaxID=1519374 RepID=A0A239PSN6_9PROT|nr:phosphocholine cytidylyltransferase family protein [Amphiplicatus metriothermophilus]MBB5519232.1 choline kinase [Amphiplicatus metriothermophilus]SNT73301.1 Choline kinase [Amphiplicatus metriothermophilus]
MKAIILSAGQGSRLLPLTNDRPKCLLPVGARATALQWQIEALDHVGAVSEIVVVTGFKSDMVDAAIAGMTSVSTPVRTVFNPFFKLADNLASCWMARAHMDGDFLIVNGDSLFEFAVLARVMENDEAPISLTINRKTAYDSDDMKVSLKNGRVAAVGKSLLPSETDAESIGLVAFRGEGGTLFRRAVEESMRDGSGLGAWYLQVIDRLARAGHVGATDIGSLGWCEIDFPDDLEAARRLVAGWERLRVVA